jgi:tetratricopeptide (TPR) repeat protein
VNIPEVFRFLRRFASRPAPSARSRALAALKRRDFETAEREFTALLLECTADERAFLYNKRGVARIGTGRPDFAATDFRAALECAPNYAPALTNLGNLLLEAGHVDAAVARYEAAILADPDYAVAYLNLGVAYKRAGRVAESVRALRRAQRLERPRNVLSFGRRRRP